MLSEKLVIWRKKLSSLIDELRAFPLFNELYDKEIKKIILSCEFSEYKEGATLNKEHIGEAIFFMLKGSAELSVEECGKRLLLRSLSDYGLCFEFCFTNSFSERVRLKFLNDSQTMVLPMSKFISIYNQDAKLYGIFTTNLLHQIFDDFSSANGLIARLFFSGKPKMGLPIYQNVERAVWTTDERSKKRKRLSDYE